LFSFNNLESEFHAKGNPCMQTGPRVFLSQNRFALWLEKAPAIGKARRMGRASPESLLRY
ncbi:hypothetical protein ACT5RU_09720, partial [Brucella amazoniensis]